MNVLLLLFQFKIVTSPTESCHSRKDRKHFETYCMKKAYHFLYLRIIINKQYNILIFIRYFVTLVKEEKSTNQTLEFLEFFSSSLSLDSPPLGAYLDEKMWKSS